MGKPNKYVNASIGSIDRHNFEVNTFYGVDYNKTQLNVANNHAVEIKNVVFRDGVNQKRYGYRTINKITPHITNGVEDDVIINGVHKFVDKDGISHLFIHNNKWLCEIKGNEVSYVENFELENEESFSFAYNNKMFILDGTRLSVVEVIKTGDFVWVVNARYVEDDEMVYIPTTTIGITSDSSGLAVNRTALDDVNMLTKWRKNKAITCIEKDVNLDEKKMYSYMLDSNVSSGSDSGITIEIKHYGR